MLLAIAECSDEIKKMVPNTMEIFSDHLNDLSRMDDFIHLMQWMLKMSEKRLQRVTACPRAYPDRASKQARTKPKQVILVPEE